jgi:hypothetical protein
MAGSIGLQNPISGGKSPLGIAIRGGVPQPMQLTDTTTLSQSRFSLREAWNTTYLNILATSNQPRIATPFRATNNAGDLLCRKDYSCGGPCQTPQSVPGLYGLSSKFGSITSKCDGTGVPPSSCNGKYVYDSSDYITYKKQKAILSNYNTASYGGNSNNASQSAYRAIRRY